MTKRNFQAQEYAQEQRNGPAEELPPALTAHLAACTVCAPDTPTQLGSYCAEALDILIAYAEAADQITATITLTRNDWGSLLCHVKNNMQLMAALLSAQDPESVTRAQAVVDRLVAEIEAKTGVKDY